MATEKKRRGESGQKNAANKPFRLNGRPPDWAAQRVGAYNVGPKQMGAHLARAAIGTILVQRLGFRTEPRARRPDEQESRPVPHRECRVRRHQRLRN